MNNWEAADRQSPLPDLQKQFELLTNEFEYEKEQYKQQTERAGIWRKIRQGSCWYPVTTGKSYYNSLNQLVVEIERSENRDMEHNFEPGRPIRFFTSGLSGSIEYLNFTATVSYVDENKMVIALPSPAAWELLIATGQPGVQLYFDETTYRTMLQALTRVMQVKEGRLAELRDIMLGSASAGKRDLFPIRFPWLNTSQDTAVNQVLAAKDVYVVHGPPGTGKTTTLVEAIFETLHRENQVMVSAQSNIAVDWIAEKLTDRGVQVLRIGNPTKVNDKMLSFTYEKRFEAHSDYPELWAIRKAIRETQAQIRKNRNDKDTVRNRLSKLRFRATELEICIDADLFREARVIACTLVGSANRLLDNHTFTTLFIDEAAQALEAACWIAITKACRVVFTGDHHQLPPTIKSPEALRGGLGHTLMEKVVGKLPEMVSLLRLQYRMHHVIMGFPSRMFYNNRLQASPEVSKNEILHKESPMTWLDTSGCEYKEEVHEESMSRFNKEEANLTLLQLQVYMEQIGRKRILEESIDFGIISPYKSQVYYLRSRIRKESYFKPYRKQISVHTVDGFQGQERDVILISMVRSNDQGHIGFLSDLRRMNVAITRTRMKLFIIGDASTLTNHTFYRELYQYVIKHGRVIPIAEK